MPGPRPRWVLHIQAQVWRYLMSIGMFLHRMAPPRPPKPSFSRTIKSTVSAVEGAFNLSFYVPDDYESRKRLRFQGSEGYPCVINFHGGGFTLGTSTDDGRWSRTVVEQCDAVVISVDYRRAPEHPFPTAVEDGVDAILYCASHARELGIDPEKIALSGFSSGANMAFSVPLRLYDHLTEFSRTLSHDDMASNSLLNIATNNTGSSSIRPPFLGESYGQVEAASTTSVNRILRSRSATTVPRVDLHAEERHLKYAKARLNECPNVELCAIVPWYPSVDYTQTRAQRRSTLISKDHDLPSVFTELFDQSYLHPPDTIPLDSPYLSPGIAETAFLRDALPREIIMHTCEFDMLLVEGQKFHERLISHEIGKNVIYKMVPQVPHGWDKAPNPIRPTSGVKEYYLGACDELRRIFGDVDRRRGNGFGAGVHGGRVDRLGSSAGSSVSVSDFAMEAPSAEDIEMLAPDGRRESRLVR